MPPQILIVDSDPSSSQSLASLIQSAGYETAHADNLDQGNYLIGRKTPQLLLMECARPKPQTLSAVKKLRQRYRSTDLPIIMLTAQDDENDRLEGFEAGVDDCLSKPYFNRELVARITAVMRRTTLRATQCQITRGPLQINLNSHRVTVDGGTVPLGPTEYALLNMLASNADRVFERHQLCEHLWGNNPSQEIRTVDVHVLRLRKALRNLNFDQCIQTVRGTGYRFSLEKTS